MRNRFIGLLVKLKLFSPILSGIILAVAILTWISIRMSEREIQRIIDNNLQIEAKSIARMFERERSLKLDKVTQDLNVLDHLFYQEPLHIAGTRIDRTVKNQISGTLHETGVNQWIRGGKLLNGSTAFVDSAYTLIGGTVTVFQKIDSGFVRISTNVLNDQGGRATWTFIPNDSPVAKTVSRGGKYIGRAYVVNNWYITAYEPIWRDDEVVGMLYAGGLEKELDALRAVLNNLSIGQTGFVFAFDETGTLVMHPDRQGEAVSPLLLKEVTGKTHGVVTLPGWGKEPEMKVAFEFYPEFGLYVCAAIDPAAESRPLISGIIRNGIILAAITVILFSLGIYLLTKKRLYRYLRQIEMADKQLTSAREALERSEEQFRTIFNSSSDEIYIGDFDGFILEVNQVSCDTLGYTREELIGKHFRELRSERFAGEIQKNLGMIRHFGQFRYETENVTRDGKVIPIEMKSRVIEYHGEKRILSIARDITERKEIEERILKAIISTEESERKRLAADLHDDLGPILSTIKLYTDMLKRGDHRNINQQETVANINELVDMAIRTSREISNRIRPNVLQDFGLAAAITEFCSFINQAKSVKIDLRTGHYTIDRRGLEESILFQVTKELINNTLRHAEASSILIDLKSINDQIILYYRDDGTGFDADEAMKSRSGLGLYNIVNKVKTINGTCDLNTTKGKGMFMTIAVKLKKEPT